MQLFIKATEAAARNLLLSKISHNFIGKHLCQSLILIIASFKTVFFLLVYIFCVFWIRCYLRIQAAVYKNLSKTYHVLQKICNVL